MKNVTFKTRHALVLSCISLMTCFAMLLGTTFAWFTDSVTSGVNHIIAGNLDVELYHQEMVNGAFGGTDTKVDSTTELFKNPATATSPMLWEPGAKAVEKFVVKNVGNLAFKYNMSLAVAGFNKVSGTKSLKDVIKVAVTDSAPGANDALTWQDLSTFTTTGAIQNGGTEKTFYVVLYWAPNDNDVDNIYNLNNDRKADDGSNKLTIDLGVTLVATQDTVEYDSFSNTYDATATYPTVITATTVSAAYSASSDTSIGNIANDNAAATVAAATTVYSDNNTTEITGVDSLALQVKPTTEAATTATTTSITVTGTENVDYYDISLVATNSTTGTETEVKSTSKVVKVEINLGTGLSNVAVNHAGTAMTAATSGAADTFTYNATTGILTLYLNSFSPFAIGYDAPVAAIGETKYATLAAAVAAARSGETVMLLRDAALDQMITIDGITIDGAGKTVTLTASEEPDCMFNTKSGTLKNMNIVSSDGRARAIGTGSSAKYAMTGDVTIDNVTVDHTLYGINVGLGNGHKMTVSNSTINGWSSGADLKFEFTNCAFAQGKTNYHTFAIYDTITFTNCTFDSGFSFFGRSSTKGNSTITMNGCTQNGTAVTASNFATLFDTPHDSDFDYLTQKCQFVFDGVATSFNTVGG